MTDEGRRLQLKSEEESGNNANDASLVLCTPNQTFNIRQVNTSNSVWITRPHHEHRANGNNIRPQVGIQAIAKVESTLELLPPSKQSAAPFIKAALPTFVLAGTYSSREIVSKESLFSHIPLDPVTCETDLRALAAFSVENSQGLCLPSVKVKARILQEIAPAATAAGIDMVTTTMRPMRVPFFLDNLVEDWPPDLLQAMVGSVTVFKSEEELVFDQALFVLHAGLSILQARAEGRSTDMKQFIKHWKDAMPEKWRDSCQLSALGGSCKTQEAGSTISYVEDSNPIFDTVSQNPAEKVQAASLGAKRKWHEKFRPSKKSS